MTTHLSVLSLRMLFWVLIMAATAHESDGEGELNIVCIGAALIEQEKLFRINREVISFGVYIGRIVIENFLPTTICSDIRGFS